MSVLDVLPGWRYTPGQILPACAGEFWWSKRKSFCKNGTRGHAASICMEITGEGLTLGAGTILAGTAHDERPRPRLALADEPRVMALLATAYGQPVEVHVLTKLRRAATLWTEGEKAL